MMKNGLWVPDSVREEEHRNLPKVDLVMTGGRGVDFCRQDDGYHCGHLRISQGDLVVEVKVTEVQAAILFKMGIGEWT